MAKVSSILFSFDSPVYGRELAIEWLVRKYLNECWNEWGRCPFTLCSQLHNFRGTGAARESCSLPKFCICFQFTPCFIIRDTYLKSFRENWPNRGSQQLRICDKEVSANLLLTWLPKSMGQCFTPGSAEKKNQQCVYLSLTRYTYFF